MPTDVFSDKEKAFDEYSKKVEKICNELKSKNQFD
jgi:hypothetical protein